MCVKTNFQFSLIYLCKGSHFIYWENQPVAHRPTDEPTPGCSVKRQAA